MIATGAGLVTVAVLLVFMDYYGYMEPVEPDAIVLEALTLASNARLPPWNPTAEELAAKLALEPKPGFFSRGWTVISSFVMPADSTSPSTPATPVQILDQFDFRRAFRGGINKDGSADLSFVVEHKASGRAGHITIEAVPGGLISFVAVDFYADEAPGFKEKKGEERKGDIRYAYTPLPSATETSQPAVSIGEGNSSSGESGSSQVGDNRGFFSVTSIPDQSTRLFDTSIRSILQGLFGVVVLSGTLFYLWKTKRKPAAFKQLVAAMQKDPVLNKYCGPLEKIAEYKGTINPSNLVVEMNVKGPKASGVLTVHALKRDTKYVDSPVLVVFLCCVLFNCPV